MKGHKTCMEFGMLIIITVMNALSLLVFLLINIETKRVVESHIELIQKVNSALVETRALKVARFCYFLALLFLVILSYFLYFFWLL